MLPATLSSYEGFAVLDGRKYPCKLTDFNSNGVYNDTSMDIREADGVWVKTGEKYYKGSNGKYIRLNGVYYHPEPAEDGSSIAFTRLRNVPTGRVAGGRWSRSQDFCYWDFSLVELAGLTMGIVGLGEIGSAVARIARGFRMKVIAHTRTPREAEGVKFVELDPLFAESDVVSLHCPLSAETEKMVDARRLSLMKPTAFLINTARGGLIDEAALAEALNSGRIAGAGLDVLSTEPPAPGNPLLSAATCLVTPHIAWASLAARKRLFNIVARNLANFIAGRPTNVVT